MKLKSGGGQHLTYCLNIHSGETWGDSFAAIQGPALRVARKIAGGEPFGLGLRLGATATEEISQPYRLAALKSFLEKENLYVFTLNGFPYGRFHGAPVKDQVYEPDWTSPLRLNYTRKLADLLAALLPEGMAGSISTVPAGFAARLAEPGQRALAVRCLLDAVQHLARVERQTGRELHLGLEPEPACLLESSCDFVRFYEEILALAGPAQEPLVRRHLGVCFDTCHVALAFEDLVEAWNRYCVNGVRISKVQLSSALEVKPCDAAREALGAFVEPVYLHQTRALMDDGALRAWDDLPAALAEWPEQMKKVRVHFHVPLFWESEGVLSSTSAALTPEFWSCLADGSCQHLEVETYTFDVLPPALRQRELVVTIADELAWALARLKSKP